MLTEQRIATFATETMPNDRPKPGSEPGPAKAPFDPSELSEALSHDRPDWDEYFMLLAKLTAMRSTCYSRPAGAVIVRDKRLLATGYNGAVPGTWHCTDKRECYWRQPENQVEGVEPRDLSRAVHAEVNAIASAARVGIALDGATVYCTLSPCMNCMKALVVAGIKKVFFEHIYDFNNAGGDRFLLSCYEKYADLVEVRRLTVSERSVRIATQFIDPPTSQRRHDHYT